MEYITAGESHGPVLTAIVSGVPAGLTISEKAINSDLARRQSGYGRGGRQAIEKDKVSVTSGVRFGHTIGSPVTLSVANRDWSNWTERMSVFGEPPQDLVREVTPRPGHADLLGVLKNDMDDCRNILERSSARETTMRVAAAGIAREFLAELGVEIYSYVVSIGDEVMEEEDPMAAATAYTPLDIEMSEVRCPSTEASERMMDAIDKAKEAGDTLGGVFRVVVTGLLPAVGGYEPIALPQSLVAHCSPVPPSRASNSVSALRLRAARAVRYTTRSFSTKRKGLCVHLTMQVAWRAE